MPTMTVHGFTAPRFTERQLYTRAGLQELAVKRYLSDFDSQVLNRFTIPGIGIPKEERAMDDYADAERADSLHELSSMASLLRSDGRPGEAKELKKLYDDAYARHPDWREWLPSYRNSWITHFGRR